MLKSALQNVNIKNVISYSMRIKNIAGFQNNMYEQPYGGSTDLHLQH